MPAMTSTLSTIAALATIAPMIAMSPQVKREFNPNRNALTEMEAAPIDQSILASLTDWSHPGTLDASRIEGKVVLLATVAAGDPQSIMTISSLTRMHRDFADQGLIVAAISQDAGYDQLQEKVASGKITIPIARDADGTFATAMHNDDNPDLYLIDRAGNLRFADIDKGALKSAIKLLTNESTETAITNAELQSKGLDPEVTVKTAEDIDSSEYANADWPKHNKNKLSAKNYQGRELPVKLGNEEWIYNERPLEGKVLVLDFWATWCGPCIRASPMLEGLQNAYDGRLEIVGIGGSEEKATFKKYVLKHKPNYAQMFDEHQILDSALGVRGIPHVVVLSTDGVIRWQGNPHNPAFKTAVAQTVAADPLLAANN